MDRRRTLLIIFFVLVALAIVDIRVNGLETTDTWGRLFDVKSSWTRPGDPSAFAQGEARRDAVRSAEDVGSFVLEQDVGVITVRGADTDEVNVAVTMHAATQSGRGAQAYADGFELSLERRGDELHAVWDAPDRPEDTKLAQLTWDVTVPKHMAVSIDTGAGFVDVGDTAAAIRVNATNADVDIVPEAAAPIDVTSIGGAINVTLPSAGLDYDVHAAVQRGAIAYPGAWNADATRSGLQRTVGSAPEGPLLVTGELGDGVHPLRIEARGGRVRLDEGP